MRYNSFYKIHKALRAMLYHAGTEIQQCDFAEQGQALQMIDEIRTVVDVFDKHAEHEDTLVFPAIEAYEPSIVSDFEQEHVKDHELGDQLKTLLAMYPTLTGNEEKNQLGSALRRAFVEFMSFNLVHMAKEEDIINNAIWRYYTDEEIKVIERSIVSKQTPEAAALAAKWMMHGLSNQELSLWMKEVQQAAPPPIFNMLLSTAEKELTPIRFRIVVGGLNEGMVLA